jgi:tetratricopeptide (TPR) repeat protein
MIVGLEKGNMINKKNMNKLFTSIAYLLVFITISSQDCFQASKANWGEDSLECRKNVSLYSEFMKQKVYPDAAKFWNKTQTFCPQYKPNLYANGAYIYRNIVKEKKKEKSAQVSLYLDTLYSVYDQWILNFGNCDEIKAAKAKDIITLSDRKNFNKAYELYREVFQNSPQITSYSDIKYFFVYGAKTLYKKNIIKCDQLLADYEMLSIVCDNNIAKGKKADKYSKIQELLDKEISPCASCDKLEEIYSSKYNADPENMDLTKKIFERLSNNKCTESNLYITLLDKVLNDPDNPPTAKDLYNAAVADYKRKEFLKAEERFNRAITICDDDKLNQKMYEILYDIAFNKKQYKKGFSIAGKLSDKCISNDKKARIVATSSSKYGNSAFNKSLIYCLALKYASSSCGKTPASAINSWNGQLLPKSELIMLDIKSNSSQQVPFWGQNVELKTRD